MGKMRNAGENLHPSSLNNHQSVVFHQSMVPHRTFYKADLAPGKHKDGLMIVE
jgi:hypothetical protein